MLIYFDARFGLLLVPLPSLRVMNQKNDEMHNIKQLGAKIKMFLHTYQDESARKRALEKLLELQRPLSMLKNVESDIGKLLFFLFKLGRCITLGDLNMIKMAEIWCFNQNLD